jgi:hypothetical protein
MAGLDPAIHVFLLCCISRAWMRENDAWAFAMISPRAVSTDLPDTANQKTRLPQK